MTYDEAMELMQGCRDGDDREPSPILQCLKRLYDSSSDADRLALNEVVRTWLLSLDPKEHYDALFLTSECFIVENLDIIRQLRDDAELREDPAAPYEWSNYNRLAGRLIAGPEV